jgi:drug/metabolite transporter (DMT)-like permease
MAAMVAAAACWGLATVLSKYVLNTLPPLTTLSLQLCGSISFLWLMVLVQRVRVAPGREGWLAAACGLFEPGLAYVVVLAGLAMTSAADASLIGATEPLLVALLAWLLLRQRPVLRVWLAIVIAGVGIVLVGGEQASTDAIAGDGTPAALVGDALVFVGTLLAAVYVVLTARLAVALPAVLVAALQQTVGLLLVAPLWGAALLLGLETLPAAISPSMMALALISGVVQYALAFWFYLLGVRGLPLGQAALFLALIPLFGVAGAVLFLGEPLSMAQGTGCALVVLAIVTGARRESA